MSHARTMAKAYADKAAATTAAPVAVNRAVRATGEHLDEETQAYMGARFGYDFGRIRIHAGPDAALAAREVNARAFTIGSDVFFGAHQFAPKTSAGRELLGHELAHTIQQRTLGAPTVGAPGGDIESSARDAGRTVAAGRQFSRSLPTCAVGLARSPQEDEEAQRRAAALAELQKAVSQTDEESPEEDAADKEADRASSFPSVTFSLLKPDKRFDAMQFDSDSIEREYKARKQAEDQARAAAQQKEDEGRDVRFLTLRTRLRHGASRSVWARVLTEKMTARDMLILRRYGLQWTRRGPDPDSIVSALDKWAASGDAHTPDRREYSALLSDEKDYYARNYAALQNYNQRVQSLASSGPASLAGRVIGTVIGGEKGGELGAAIGGFGDAMLPVYAARRVPRASSMADEPSAPGPATYTPRQASSAPPPARINPTANQPRPMAMTDVEVVQSHVWKPSSVSYREPAAHQRGWQAAGGEGVAPLAFRGAYGVSVSTSHRLNQPATKQVVPPWSSGARNDAPSPAIPFGRKAAQANGPVAAKPAPAAVDALARTGEAPPAAKAVDPLARTGEALPAAKAIDPLAKTGEAPPVSKSADPLAKTGEAPSSVPAAVKPAGASSSGNSQARSDTVDTGIGGDSRFSPPQAVSREMVQQIRQRPRPAPTGNRRVKANNVSYAIDHDHHLLAWRRLGGRGDAPPAFIFDGQVYLDPLRWRD